MIEPVPPQLIFIAGALLLSLLRGRLVKQVAAVLVPAVALVDLFMMPEGAYWKFTFMHYQLVWGSVDRLSLCFGYGFAIIALLGMIYALHIKKTGQHVAALLYAGSALGVTFAGDLLTLFLFWEVMAISSVFLIWYQGEKRSIQAGFRYILIHLFGGGSLLAGIMLHLSQTGSLQFGVLTSGTLSSNLILLGFIINAAVPPFHAWLSDAYPEATVTGSVFLSAFTTKSAVYVLLRAFPGAEVLVWLGAVMAVYGVIYTVLENNMRRLLSYHIISQVGYMVCGVGLGTALSMDGSTAHAFCNILYKALLFMGVGGIIEVTGKTKLTELEGRSLYKTMPVCLVLYMVGAFSISGVPLFNGFVSKSMVLASAGEAHRPLIHLLLHLASIGTFLSVGLKLPFRAWFGKGTAGEPPRSVRAKEPPLNMLVAMALTAFLCLFIGIYPRILYDILPYGADFHPYRAYPVISTMQLLIATSVVFWLLREKLKGTAAISLDVDWFYRRGGLVFLRFCGRFENARGAIQGAVGRNVKRLSLLSVNPIEAVKALTSGRKRRSRPYDANRYRHAIGQGVMLFLVLFSLLCLILYSVA